MEVVERYRTAETEWSPRLVGVEGEKGFEGALGSGTAGRDECSSAPSVSTDGSPASLTLSGSGCKSAAEVVECCAWASSGLGVEEGGGWCGRLSRLGLLQVAVVEVRLRTDATRTAASHREDGCS